MRQTFTILLILCSIPGFSQMLTIDASRLLPSKSEEVDYTFLIHEPVLENNSKDILYKLYNFQFSEVESDIKELRKEYPSHPVSYFIESLISWWQILALPESRDYDDRFVENIDATISIAENLYNTPESSVEAAFFLSASYGLKSQFMMKRKSWTKSAMAGRNSLSYLKEIEDKSDLSKEILFGQGLFNYYVEYLPNAYPLLKPITAVLPDGDMELGKKQLQDVYENASYTKIEAAVYLIEILKDSNAADRLYAKKMVSSLVDMYPNNVYFRDKLKGL